MLTFFSLILCLIFLTISLFHFYWAFGGDWGLEHVVPKTSSEEKALKPPLFLTIIVAIAFLAMMTLYLFHLGYLSWAIPEWIITASSWFIPSVFLLRAIGEFRYVGLFKKVKNTSFAEADTKLFVPLCLLISGMGYAIVAFLL